MAPSAGKSSRAIAPAKGASEAAPKAAKTGPAVSPLAPKSLAKLQPISGVRLGAGAAGIRYEGRTDVLIAVISISLTPAVRHRRYSARNLVSTEACHCPFWHSA